MKVLLDENVPVQISVAFAGHVVVTVTGLGWKGISNGDLLVAAENEGFDAIVLADKNLRYQQNLVGRRIAIIELWTNHRPTLERHLPLVADAVNRAAAGDYILVTPA